jgi:hypothetical protein
MKKLAILASVVMIFTAPIMAQTPLTLTQEELPSGGLAPDYGFFPDAEDSQTPGQKEIEGRSTELVPETAPTDVKPVLDPAATYTVENPAGDLKQTEEESEQPTLNSAAADVYRAGDKTSVNDTFFNNSPSLAPTIK